jgi:hypothetical protein
LYTAEDAQRTQALTPQGILDPVDLVARVRGVDRNAARRMLYAMHLPTSPLPPLTREAIEGIQRLTVAHPIKRQKAPYTPDIMSAFDAHTDTQGALVVALFDEVGLSGAWVGDHRMGRGVALGRPTTGGGRVIVLESPAEAIAHATLQGGTLRDAYACIGSPDDLQSLQAHIKGRPVVLASINVRYLGEAIPKADHDLEPPGGWLAEIKRNPPAPPKIPTPTRTPAPGFLDRVRDVIKPRQP